MLANAKAVGASARVINHAPNKKENPLGVPTQWVVISWNDQILANMGIELQNDQEIKNASQPWTDQYANPLGNYFYNMIKRIQ